MNKIFQKIKAFFYPPRKVRAIKKRNLESSLRKQGYSRAESKRIASGNKLY